MGRHWIGSRGSSGAQLGAVRDSPAREVARRSALALRTYGPYSTYQNTAPAKQSRSRWCDSWAAALEGIAGSRGAALWATGYKPAGTFGRNDGWLRAGKAGWAGSRAGSQSHSMTDTAWLAGNLEAAERKGARISWGSATASLQPRADLCKLLWCDSPNPFSAGCWGPSTRRETPAPTPILPFSTCSPAPCGVAATLFTRLSHASPASWMPPPSFSPLHPSLPPVFSPHPEADMPSHSGTSAWAIERFRFNAPLPTAYQPSFQGILPCKLSHPAQQREPTTAKRPATTTHALKPNPTSAHLYRPPFPHTMHAAHQMRGWTLLLSRD
jgi:hypothetical protein